MFTVYLHIGMPKTGTSYIQKFLHDNNKILNKKGYCFPNFGITFDGIEVYRNGHFLVCQMKNETGNRDYNSEEKIFNSCFEKIKKLSKKYSKIIISDESIWDSSNLNYSGDLWSLLLKKAQEYNFKIKVVVYLRRQDLFIQSFWAQQVKGTCQLDFNEYIKTNDFKFIRLDYYTRLMEIASFVGKNNIIVRPYEIEQFKNSSLVNDFLESIGLQLTEDYYLPPKRINISLEGAYLETKLRVNKAYEPLRIRRGFLIGDLKKVMNNNKKNPELAKRVNYFTYEEQLKFMEQYKTENQQVAKEFLNKEDYILFVNEIIKNEAESGVDYTHEQILGILGKVITNKNKEIERLKEDNKAKQQVIEQLKGSFIEKQRAKRNSKKKAKEIAKNGGEA